MGPTESTKGRGAGRPARQLAIGATGYSTGFVSGLAGGAAGDRCVRVWEGAYRHYGRMWELTARSPKGDPAAAREMAAASRAVAAAWRAIEADISLPWWVAAALHSAAAAFDEQAQKYDKNNDKESPGHPQSH